jgi:hypothetical protein
MAPVGTRAAALVLMLALMPALMAAILRAILPAAGGRVGNAT